MITNKKRYYICDFEVINGVDGSTGHKIDPARHCQVGLSREPFHFQSNS